MTGGPGILGRVLVDDTDHPNDEELRLLAMSWLGMTVTCEWSDPSDAHATITGRLTGATAVLTPTSIFGHEATSLTLQIGNTPVFGTVTRLVLA